MQTWGSEHGVVVPVRRAVLSRAELREALEEWGEFRRSSHGFFVPRYVELTPEQRVAEAGALVVAPAAVTGWGAMAWLRSRWFTGLEGDGETPRPVPIAQPRRLVRPQPLVTLCEERFDHREVIVDDGLRITNAVRSTCFEMRYASHLRAAVVILSMAAYNDHVSIDEVEAWALRHPSYTGIDQCRRAVSLADENAWSPAEVEMVLDWTELVGFRPLMNRPLFDLGGRHIGTPDVIDPRTGVIGEYDGPLHLSGARRAVDLKRQADFERHGLFPVTMVAADRRDQSAWQERMRAAYARAERTPATERQWTLEPPSWWVPTWTVEQRRSLSEQQRLRWLALRMAG
jgi:hypothetical protein